MIIVEGPDNSGKTTLIDSLKAEFGLRLLRPAGGPPKSCLELSERCEYIIKEASLCLSKRLIVDRISLIGESIYGPICRGKDLWTEIPQIKADLLYALNCLDPFYIYCRPPIHIIQNLDTHQIKEYDTEEHLEKIKERSNLIIKAYDNYFNPFSKHRLFVYDYTRPSSYYNLINLLKEYLKW